MSDLTLLLAELSRFKTQKPAHKLPIPAVAPRPAIALCTALPNHSTPESDCPRFSSSQSAPAPQFSPSQAHAQTAAAPAAPEAVSAPQFSPVRPTTQTARSVAAPAIAQIPRQNPPVPGLNARLNAPTLRSRPMPPASQPNPRPLRLASRLEPALPELLPTTPSHPQNTALNPYLPGNLPSPETHFDTTWATQIRPRSGSQLYHQRLEALRQGKTYTRLPANSFHANWATARQQPTYAQWQTLLRQEAAAMARGQGKSKLTVMVGDSISQWYPVEQLSSDRFWLNQGISGDMTSGILQRLPAFDATHPDTIHVMAGVNDLKNGKSDREILANLRKIMRYLRQQHQDATIVVHSILPTRTPAISSDRVANINAQLTAIAQTESVSYLDLTADFVSADGNLRQDLTTDGIHLSPTGYAMWGRSLQRWQQSATNVARMP